MCSLPSYSSDIQPCVPQRGIKHGCAVHPVSAAVGTVLHLNNVLLMQRLFSKLLLSQQNIQIHHIKASYQLTEFEVTRKLLTSFRHKQTHTQSLSLLFITLTSALQFGRVVVLSGFAVTLVAAYSIQTKASFTHLLAKQYTFICICKEPANRHMFSIQRGK